MDKILDVKNLRVSFRTSGGTVKAVRDISFELERGKTLAIVGESGSGKSVTSKAILGILAGNSIIESGEILYDGKDLLKISEEEMCDIRGNRISMIFQDPLSSLNPIVKIGRQITEAMLLKDKGNRREAKREFNEVLGLVKQNSIAALGEGSRAQVEEHIKTFENFNAEAIRMENAYNTAKNAAEDLIAKTEDFLFLTSKKQKVDVKGSVKTIADKLKTVKNEFFSHDYDAKLDAAAQELGEAVRGFKPAKDQSVPDRITEAVKRSEDLLRELDGRTVPEFFRIGFYKMQNPHADLHGMPVEELNAMTREYLDRNFMIDFLGMEEKGVRYSFETEAGRRDAQSRPRAVCRAQEQPQRRPQMGQRPGPAGGGLHRPHGDRQGLQRLYLPLCRQRRDRPLLQRRQAQSQGGGPLCPPVPPPRRADRQGPHGRLEGRAEGRL